MHWNVQIVVMANIWIEAHLPEEKLMDFKKFQDYFKKYPNSQMVAQGLFSGNPSGLICLPIRLSNEPSYLTCAY